MAIRKRIYSLIVPLILLMEIPSAWSIEWQPWVGNYLEFEWRNTLFYQTYPRIASDSHLIDHAADDFFVITNLSNSLAPEFSVELEMTAAYTHRQRGQIDNIRLAGRYMWQDDLLGDPLSLTTGVILTQAFAASLHDVSSFHHGRGEAEGFISIGRETPLGITWRSRWWGVLGIGCAERGSAWLRGIFGYEYRLCAQHEIRLFVHTLWGLGTKRLKWHDFHGYGPIHHQSIDLGLRYTYLIPFFGSLSFEYTNRAYARNFPAQTSQFLLSLDYHFGL